MASAAILIAFGLTLGATVHAGLGAAAADPARSVRPLADSLGGGAAADSTAAEPGSGAPAIPGPRGAAPAPGDSVAGAARAPAPTIVERHPPRGLVARAGHSARAFVSDCAYVAASPLRLRARGLAELGLAAGAEAAIYAYDSEIMAAAQRNHDQPVLHAMHKLGDALEDAGFMPHTLEAEGAVWVLGAALHSDRTRTICQELIEAHLIGGGIRNALKVLVGRAHPFEDRGPRQFEFGKGTSFPSGHTSIYFEAATILSHHARVWPAAVVFYGIATVGAVQRVQARAHWASDVFLPIISGTLIGQTVARRNEEREARWQPRIDTDGGSLRIGIQRRF